MPYVARTVFAMAGPTPQQWWDSLDEADRGAFMDQVATRRRASFDLWMKLRDAEVLAHAGDYAGEPLEILLPGPFLRYVFARAAERV
jgi:hypothetical protein